ncbi:L-histidine N(alpha)-methyltransferase [Thermomonas sp.]|uniref:L-histidine N(alpha)-methyltransferase n=1 Tax=Thermomonas sp. TaxID=1971895 RepID=UPI002489C5B1|nr:L-histidine N(alpha)-methyltransferase [Thermomonas sp.]MDI1252231.1 L-histidine N(alpha)-methyltransferase [Thermomonas sp.]
MNATLKLTDLHPSPDDITGDVLAGLSRMPKRLPSKYFYDKRGSELFEQITHQPEYYLTRVELALLQASGAEIADEVGPRAHVVEYGSGSGRKTRILLDALDDPVAYTPIEISRSALLASVERLDREFGDVEVLPVLADFTQPVPLPKPARKAEHAFVFFPGSTLGNFTAPEALRLLRAMHQTMGDRGGALLGIDLQKSPQILEAAYNDAAGVTAAFTLNLLARLNRDIGSDFDLEGFTHCAHYAAERGRIETFLVSQKQQTVQVQGRSFDFSEGEAMQVEYSHKYTDAGFAAMAAEAELKVVRGWNDPQDWFGLRLLQRV